jgi:hypothetical protein
MPQSQLPPEAMAALQQQQAGGTDITSILAQLAEMSPDEVAAALQQLGINVDPSTLHDAAAQWVENAGDKQAGSGADDDQQAAAADGEGKEDAATTSPPSTPSAPTTDDEAAEATPDDEDSEGEGEVATAGQGGAGAGYPVRAGGTSRSAPTNAANVGGRGGGGAGGGGGMNMDALISAALSQGDPNSMPPPMPMPMRPPGASAQMRGGAPTMPTAPTAAGEDPRMRAMIGSIYRDAASKPRAASAANTRTRTSTRMPPTVASRRR